MADGTLNYEFKVDVPTASVEHGTEKVEQLHKSLEKLNHSGGKHAESLEHKIRHSAGGVGHAVNYAKNEVHELLEVLGLVLAFEIGEKIVDKLFEIGEEAIKAAAAAERMDLSFKLSLGQEGGAEMVEFLERITGKTEFADDQLKSWGKTLLNAGVAAGELDKFMAAALDVAAKSPDKLEGMSHAVQALSRASMSGAVDMRQLRGLSIGVDQLRTLPKFAHMSVKQLHKEMEQGKLTKEDLLSVIAGPDKILGDLGIQAGKTMEARMLHLRHVPEEIFQKLAKTEAFDRLSASLARILEKLDPDGPFGKKVLGGLEHALGTFADIVDNIDFDEIADVITDDVVPAIEKMMSLLKDVIEGVERIIRGFHRMADFATKVDSGVKGAATGIHDPSHFTEGPAVAAARAARADKAKALVAGLETKADLGNGTKAYHGAFHMVGEAAGEGLSEGMEKSEGKVKQAGGEMAGGAEEGAKKKLKTRSPSVVFEDIGAMTAAGFAMGMDGSSEMVSDAVDAMLAIPRGGARAAGAGGGVTVAITIDRVDVHAGAGATEADGAAAARGFAGELRPAFIDLLEQIRQEMGA